MKNDKPWGIDRVSGDQGIESSKQAFALRDLLCLLTVAALLVSVTVSSLGQNGVQSTAGYCRNSLRQLIQAWQMYADDHSGRITPTAQGTSAGQTASFISWVGGWLDNTSNFDNFNINYLVNPTGSTPYAGLLGEYLQRNHLPFRCAADQSSIVVFGRRQSRVRSVSMNTWMGGQGWGFANNFIRYRSQGEISAPSQRWVIIEEREDSINDPSFYVDMDPEKTVDFPASYHDGGAFLNFADGHVEYRRWTDPRTNPTLVPEQFIPLNVLQPGNADIEWLRAGATELR